MIEIINRQGPVNLPYTIYFPGVTEETFEAVIDEETRAELLDGLMVVHCAATLQHDDIAGFLRGLMALYAEERDLGTVLGPRSLVRLGPSRLVRTDAYFVRTGRRLDRHWMYYEGVPDLVVHVVTSASRDVDLGIKRRIHRSAGTGEIWFVELDEKRLTVDCKHGEQYREQVVTDGMVTSTVIDGFWIESGWLWKRACRRELTCLRKILGKRWPWPARRVRR